LGKYFIETRQLFGAKTSVANYDIVGNTILSIAKTKSEIPNKFVHRQIDDVPVVSSASKNWCKNFLDIYVKICEDLNMVLAPECPKNEKAFKCKTNGKVLGIIFDTEDLSWSLPKEKIAKTILILDSVLDKGTVDLEVMQELMVRLNDFGQLSYFPQGFKGPLNRILGKLQQNPICEFQLIEIAKKDLKI